MIAARTEKDLHHTAEQVKQINPKTQVVEVVTDVTDKASVENLFQKAFAAFDKLDVRKLVEVFPNSRF